MEKEIEQNTPAPEPRSPWALDAEGTIKALRTDLQSGLSPTEAAGRLARNGFNELRVEAKVPEWRKFLRQFKSPVVLVLVGAVVLSLFVGEKVDALAIAAILILNALIGYLQEAKAEKAIEALKRMAQPRAKVVRGGAVSEIPSRDVVLGDLLLVEAGDYVAADARVLEERGLSVNESALTGESLPVDKTTGPLPAETPTADRVNMLFSGTAVSAGSGRVVVTATAMATEFGRVAALLSAHGEEATPLQKRLEKVSRFLLLFCLGAVALVAALESTRGLDWFEIFLTAISLAVASIPEGLPAVVTLALALAVRRMAQKNALVRRLSAVETLGSTDVICTDKTGTLTTGQMTVREIWAGGKILKREEISLSDPAARGLLLSCVAASSAALSEDGRGIGDTTEIALLQLAREAGLKRDKVLKRVEWPFDSDRKRMSVAEQGLDGVLIHVKGAAEFVLPLCDLTQEKRREVERSVEDLSSLGRRLLAVAVRDVGKQGKPLEEISDWGWEQVEEDLTFLGLISLADPPRPEAIQAVADCKKAGIQVVMVTGDHPATARAIAAEMGILKAGVPDGVLTGVELAAMSDEDLAQKVESTAVYARVTPEHKLRILQAWKSKGRVAAMTGDGVNDAPALKAASIGVAMGKTGTEVARQASAMVLSDDNFATIVSAVGEGRAIHDNIRRTIRYLLTGNTAEIMVMLGAALLDWPVPLLPIHLLWINLVTDGFPALALAAEPVPKDVLAVSKRSSPESFSSPVFYRGIAWTGGLVAALTLVVYGVVLREEGEAAARTCAFSFLVFEELFRSFAGRSDRRTFFQMKASGNPYLFLAVALPLAFQLAVHHFSFTQVFFKVQAIEGGSLLLLLTLSLVPVTLLETAKLLRR